MTNKCACLGQIVPQKALVDHPGSIHPCVYHSRSSCHLFGCVFNDDDDDGDDDESDDQ